MKPPERKIGLGKLTVILICLLGLASPAVAGDGEFDTATGQAAFHVNFRYPATTQQIEDAKTALTHMSRIICDGTEGQFFINQYRLTAGVPEEDRAGFWFINVPGRSGGFISIDGSDFTTLGRRLSLTATGQFRGDVLAHEFGHHAFGLGEQYDEQRRFGGMDRACGIGRGFEAGTVDEQNHSVMQQSGKVQCVGGTNAGDRCLRDADCPGGGTCEPVLMSEFSVPGNHDPVRGGGGVCPPAFSTTQGSISGRLAPGALIDIFDATDFDTAEATSEAVADIPVFDDVNTTPAARLKFYFTHSDVSEWTVSAVMDSGDLGGTAEDLTLLEQWVLTFNGNGSLNSISEDPPTLSILGLASGGSDLNINLNFGTPNPTATPGLGFDGVRINAAFPFLLDFFDGNQICPADDCAERWNPVTLRWETTDQSLSHNFDSDWETITENYPTLAAPAGLPVSASPALCNGAINFDEDIRGSDQVILVMDHSGSMGFSSNVNIQEVCGNGEDDDGDFVTDEANCAEPRINFVQAAGRAFLDMQQDLGIEVGLLKFDHFSVLVRPIGLLSAANIDDFKNDVDTLTPAGSTGIGNALDASLEEFNRVAAAGRSQTAFLLTDGYNNTGVDPEAAADRLRAEDIRVYTIPAGTDVDSGLLGVLANKTGGVMIASEEVSELPSVYAEMAGRYRGSSLVVPRTRFLLAAKPQAFREELSREKVSNPTEKVFSFYVEKGAKNLGMFLGGRNPDMTSWNLDFELQGPSGEIFTASHPRVIRDPFYTLLNISKPTSGFWTLRVRPGNDFLQTSTFLAWVDNPRPRLFSDARPRLASPPEPVKITADPIYVVDLDEPGVHLNGLVRRPDGTETPITFDRGPGSAWAALFSQYSVRGVYEARIFADVEDKALPFVGEPIFEGPERLPIKVERFQRFTTASFFLNSNVFPDCKNSDCDGDGIPNEKECGKDTDQDGVPDMWDGNSDNDEIPDAIELNFDRNKNGVMDRCEPTKTTGDSPRDKPSLDDIIEKEKKVIGMICSDPNSQKAKFLLMSSLKDLTTLQGYFARKYQLLNLKQKYKAQFEEAIKRKKTVLTTLGSNKANCKWVGSVLGGAIQIEEALRASEQPNRYTRQKNKGAFLLKK